MGRNRYRWGRLAIVVGGVTPTQGVWESHTKGEGPEIQPSSRANYTEVVDLKG